VLLERLPVLLLDQLQHLLPVNRTATPPRRVVGHVSGCEG
jgi:hypothetical protein